MIEDRNCKYIQDPPTFINAGDSHVSESQMKASAGYLFKFRRLVVAWADQIFEAAAEIAKLQVAFIDSIVAPSW